jgi:hypothetical protein
LQKKSTLISFTLQISGEKTISATSTTPLKGPITFAESCFKLGVKAGEKTVPA